MRTTIDIDDELLAEVIKETGETTKRAAIEEAMREYVGARRRARFAERIRSGDIGIDLTPEELRKMRGK